MESLQNNKLKFNSELKQKFKFDNSRFINHEKKFGKKYRFGLLNLI